MAQKIKGVSGLIPAFTLWMDYRAGKRDGKNRELFEQVIKNANDPQKCSEAYCAIPWVGKKVACYNKHCHLLYQDAVHQVAPIAKSVEEERITFEIKSTELVNERNLSPEEQTPGYIPALEQEMQDILKRAGGQGGEIDNIDALLATRIGEAREELNFHINRYREGINIPNLPMFYPDKLVAPVDKAGYSKLIGDARDDIQKIM